jgi:hypothetical protein
VKAPTPLSLVKTGPAHDVPAGVDVTPIVNMNGTSKASLLDGYLKCREAVDTAIVALGDATPHGRDYPGADDRYKAARAEWRKMIDELVGLDQRILAVALRVNEQ